MATTRRVTPGGIDRDMPPDVADPAARRGFIVIWRAEDLAAQGETDDFDSLLEKAMSTHWMAFVNWKTVVQWKDARRSDSVGSGTHPYQYSSNSSRFLEIESGDVLWIITTPRFGKNGQPTNRGRARPPAVMARLRVCALCCNGRVDGERKRPVCAGRLPDCAATGVLPQGVSPSSDAWSIVAIGDPDPDDPDAMHTTYPPLYNMFGILRQLRFQTGGGESDLRDYLDWVEAGQYLRKGQSRVAQDGNRDKDPGPYSAFGRRFQSPRKLTACAAREMDDFHRHAVDGKTVFFSYRWHDVDHIAALQGRDRKSWIRELNARLYGAGYNNWLDHHQIFTTDATVELLQEILKDAVRQSVVFAALLTPTYGEGWTHKEWKNARKRANNPRFQNRMRRLVLDAGGDIDLTGDEGVLRSSVGETPTPRQVAEAIRRLCSED